LQRGGSGTTGAGAGSGTAGLTRFRCGHCSGPLFVDEFDIVMVRAENLEEMEDRPRHLS